MIVKISSIGLKGLEGYRVQVQVHVSDGKESMVIVGLPDTSVKESKVRVLSAIHTLGCEVSEEKIVVNLSPSEQKKNGQFFDLAMAIGILIEKGELKEKVPEDSVFIGALSLDGAVEKVEGMLPALIAATSLGFKRAYLPYDPLIPLVMLEGLECIVIQHIQDVLKHLSGQEMLPLHKVKLPSVGVFYHPPLMVSCGPQEVGHADVATRCGAFSLCSFYGPLRTVDPPPRFL